jgi:hypothetical protein
MGGGIAQELGVPHAERVVSLTLIATSPIGDGADRPELPPAVWDDVIPAILEHTRIAEGSPPQPSPTSGR